jgi:hypothetical protein
MKTMLLVTAAMLGIGIGSSYAGDGHGPLPVHCSTQLPGVIAATPMQQAPNSVASNQNGSAPAVFVTHHSSAVSVFPWNAN